MSSQDLARAAAPVVRMTQIIVVALVLGVVTFAVVAVVLVGQGGGGGAGDLLAPLAMMFTVVAFLMASFVPRLVVKAARRRIANGSWSMPAQSEMGIWQNLGALGDDGALVFTYQNKTIVTAAILEGAAFFCLVAYMLGGNWQLLVAVGLLLVALLTQFPTLPRVLAWVEYQRSLMQQDRRDRM